MDKRKPVSSHRWRPLLGVSEIFKLVRYAFIGLSVNLVGYGMYLLLTWLGAEPVFAMTILYVVGATCSFFANRSWTYRHKGSAIASSWRFVVVYGAGYLTNFVLLVAFANCLGYPHQVIQAMAIPLVAVELFLLMDAFVFPEDCGRSVTQ